ncbi:hypothetical protein SpCBS45565_g02842 [Spizellomyces sp. 'palustris']|nr:hypothetical protein SpCBS45565_g02842 [Spizellomyces sp. 'palustris']
MASPKRLTYLSGDCVYVCLQCQTHLASHEDLISRAFMGRTSRAFLFCAAENVAVGAKEDRLLITGLHTVADISCTVCRTVVGWKYLFAFEQSQKYKEGTYIIEKARIAKENREFW